MKTLLMLLVVAAAAVMPNAVQASGHHGHGHRKSCCGSPPVQCPQCHCELKIENEKYTRTCFEVECEAICIPPIRFPWEKCCPPSRCAKVRNVHVLKTESYECERCKYTWTPVCQEGCAGCRPGRTEAAPAAAPAPAASPDMPPAPPQGRQAALGPPPVTYLDKGQLKFFK